MVDKYNLAVQRRLDRVDKARQNNTTPSVGRTLKEMAQASQQKFNLPAPEQIKQQIHQERQQQEAQRLANITHSITGSIQTPLPTLEQYKVPETGSITGDTLKGSAQGAITLGKLFVDVADTAGNAMHNAMNFTENLGQQRFNVKQAWQLTNWENQNATTTLLQGLGYNPKQATADIEQSKSGLYHKGQKELQEKVAQQKTYVGQMGTAMWETLKNPYLAGSMLGQSAPLMLAGGGVGSAIRAGAMARGATRLASWGGAIGEGTITGASMLSDMKSNGIALNADNATKVAGLTLGTALLGKALNGAGNIEGRLAGTAGGFGGSVKNAVTDVSKENLQEQLQEALNSIIEQSIYHPDKPIDMTAVAIAQGQGGALGTHMSGGMAVIDLAGQGVSSVKGGVKKATDKLTQVPVEDLVNPDHKKFNPAHGYIKAFENAIHAQSKSDKTTANNQMKQAKSWVYDKLAEIDEAIEKAHKPETLEKLNKQRQQLVSKYVEPLERFIKATDQLVELTNQMSTTEAIDKHSVLMDLQRKAISLQTIKDKTQRDKAQKELQEALDSLSQSQSQQTPQTQTNSYTAPIAIMGTKANGGTGRGTDHYDLRLVRGASGKRGDIRPYLDRFSVLGKTMDSYKTTSDYGVKRGDKTHEGIDFGINGTFGGNNEARKMYLSPKWQGRVKSVRTFDNDQAGGGQVTEVIFDDGVGVNILHQDRVNIKEINNHINEWKNNTQTQPKQTHQGLQPNPIKVGGSAFDARQDDDGAYYSNIKDGDKIIKHYAFVDAPSSEIVSPSNVKGISLKRGVHKDALEPLKKMIADAKAQGVNLTVVSDYRSYSDQQRINENNFKKKGVSAFRTSAPSGYSEHSTGLAIDFNSVNGADFKQGGKHHKAHQWLLANAHKYGFTQTFTEEYSKKTNVSVEEWHWKFTETDRAKELLTPIGRGGQRQQTQAKPQPQPQTNAINTNLKEAVFFGDSIAAGYQSQHKSTKGITKGAKDTGWILGQIKSYVKNNPNGLQGQTVILSSGYSNTAFGTDYKGRATPSQRNTALNNIAEQLRVLKSNGANVVLLGVADNFNLYSGNGNQMNADLAQLAKEQGVHFTGGLGNAKDNVHPNYAKNINLPNGQVQQNQATTQTKNNQQDIATGVINSQLVKIGNRYFSNDPLMSRIISVESGGNPTARRENSQYRGLLQLGNHYTLSNWKDPQENFTKGKEVIVKNIRALQQAGIPITPATVYLSHQQGLGGITAIYREATGGKAVSSQIRSNMDNNLGRGKTAKQFIDFWENKLETRYQSVMKELKATPIPMGSAVTNTDTQATETTSTQTTDTQSQLDQLLAELEQDETNQELQEQVDELKAQLETQNNTGITEEQLQARIQEEMDKLKAEQSKNVAIRYAQINPDDSVAVEKAKTEIDELQASGLMSEAQADNLRKLLDIKVAIKGTNQEDVHHQIVNGRRGSNNLETNLGLKDYDQVLTMALASNDPDTATIERYMGMLTRFRDSHSHKAKCLVRLITKPITQGVVSF